MLDQGAEQGGLLVGREMPNAGAEHDAPQERARFESRARLACALALGIFVALSLAYCATRFPAWDEGLYADVAHQLALDGELRSRSFGATGSFGHDPLPRMDERTYWTTPGYPLAIGAWFRVIGTGLVQARLPSILFGLLLLAAWGSIVRSTTGSAGVAYAAVGLIALGSHVLWAASIGRPDMLSAGLAAWAIAAHLRLREQSLTRALCCAAALLALAGLAHPMALVEGAMLLALVLFLDARRLRPTGLLLAAGIGTALLLPWFLYILQDVETFRAQWGANTRARTGGFENPLAYLAADLRERYLAWHFAPGPSGLRILEPISLLLCFSIALLTPAVRRARGIAPLAIMALVGWMALAVLDGKRWIQYFVHVFPAYTAFAAVVLCRLAEPAATPRRARAARGLALTLALMLVVPGAGGIALRVWQDPYRTQFLPAVRALEPFAEAGAVILAPSELGFAFGFDGRAFRDDMEMRSRADVYVRGEFTLLDVPGTWQRAVGRVLEDEFERHFENQRYVIYVRR